MAKPQILRTVRSGVDSFGPGQEAELQAALSTDQIAALESKGAIQGFGTGAPKAAPKKGSKSKAVSKSKAKPKVKSKVKSKAKGKG